jgi:hypothetical protein
LEDVEAEAEAELEFGAGVEGMAVVIGAAGKEVTLEGCSPESNSYIF